MVRAPGESLDIVIVNWNTGPELRRCLESLVAFPPQTARIVRVVVVDNGSEDGSATGLGEIALPLLVVANDVNVGFAAACNQGAAESTADLLLFLNPDTQVRHGSLDIPLQYLRSPQGQDVGICGVHLEDSDGRQAIVAARYPSVRVIVGEITGLGRVLPSWFPRHLLSAAETATSRDVDQVIGAFFMVRRSLFEQLSGFDERFFVYYEEVDLALRAAQAGFRSHLLTNARAIHHGGLSSDQVRARRLFYSLRSRLLYVDKHFHRTHRLAVYVVTFLVEPLARMAQALVVQRSLRAAGETLSGYRLLLTDRPFLSRRP